MSNGDSFDDFLSTVGFGRWQLPSLMVTVLAMSQFSVHLIGSPLLSAPMSFRCSILPLNLGNDSVKWSPSPHFDEQCLPVLTTTTASTSTSTTSSTTTTTNTTTTTAPNIAARPLTNVVAIPNTSVTTSTSTSTHASRSLVPLTTWRTTDLSSCPLIQYDTSVFTSSVISEWDLVCERATLRPLFQTLFTVGGIIGSTLGGHIGDRCGRRRAVVGACVVNLVVVVAMALAPVYPLLIVLRCIAGCSIMAMLVPAWSLTLESTPAGCRSRVGMLLGLPFSASTVLFAVAGCFIREWRTLLLVCSSPILILLPVAFMTDESPRWLVQQAKVQDATRVMHKALVQNKVQLTPPLTVDTLVEQLVQESKVTSGGTSPSSAPLLAALRQVWSYLRAPTMRTIIIVTPVLWFLQSCLYLGVLINANNFTSTDPFLYLALSGLMEAVAIVVITPLTSHLGRRVMVWAGLAVGGALLMLELLVPEDSGYYWVDWLLVMIGFLLVAGAFQVNYVYAPELFPTEARARGFAFVNVMGSVGFSCAPLITHVLAEYAWWAVSVTFGCAGILGSLLVPLLPETNKRPLPETLQDVENRRCTFMLRREKRRHHRPPQEEESGGGHSNMTPLLEAVTSGPNTPESPQRHQDPPTPVPGAETVGIGSMAENNSKANNSVL